MTSQRKVNKRDLVWWRYHTKTGHRVTPPICHGCDISPHPMDPVVFTRGWVGRSRRMKKWIRY